MKLKTYLGIDNLRSQNEVVFSFRTNYPALKYLPKNPVLRNVKLFFGTQAFRGR